MTQEARSAERATGNKETNPTRGGSYVRQPDGSLKRVAGTEPAPGRNDGRKKSGQDEAAFDAEKGKKQQEAGSAVVPEARHRRDATGRK